MDYEKAYKEALKRAKNLPYDTDKEVAGIIFPELVSEDEKIRKEIISALNMWYDDESLIHPLGKYTKKQAVSWLEKLKDRYIVGVDMGVSTGDKGCVVNFENKPRFKAGDWVIDKQDIVHQISNVEKIVANNTYGYGIVGGGYFNDETEGVRLWTIQDAEDGDVLVESNCDAIIMFRGVGNIKRDDVIDYHCYYNCHWKDFIIQEGGSHWCNIADCTLSPATKEQRDLLFQKMKESGYEWDADKKELVRVEQKPIDKIKPKFRVGDVMRTLQEASDDFTDGMPVVVSIDDEYYHCTNELIAIKNQDDYEYPPINREQKPAWSVKDDKFVVDTMNFLYRTKNQYAQPARLEECIDWLKSLKDRIIK